MPKALPGPRTKREQSHKYIITDRKRRLGLKNRPGDSDQLYKKLTESLTNIPSDGWESFEQHPYFQYTSHPFYRTQVIRRGKRVIEERPLSATGGVFNLEYSPDGKILSAACEKKNILIFDPLTRKIVKTIENAHTDCVNCVRFLDTRTFASCSDDTTAALWDVRNLKSRIRTLHGHSNWVKNIEYSRQNNLLVTSGFDGAIFTWELNQYTDGSSNPSFKKVFNMSHLMRMRLTPDAEKMVISTGKGCLLVIHDIDLDTMAQDLAGFKPNMYREMQITGRYHELALNHTKLFHAKKNRVEIISDFADGNDAELISSLRIHPQGWVAATRNLSQDENSEWCCVHDIQTVDTREEEDTLVSSTEQNYSDSTYPFFGNPLWSRSLPDQLPEQEPELNEDDDIEPRVQRFRSGNIEIISTGVPTANDAPRSMRVNIRLRNQSDSSSSDEEEDNSNDPESVNVDGTNFLSAETLDALGVDRGGEDAQDESENDQAPNDPRVRPPTQGWEENNGAPVEVVTFRDFRTSRFRIPRAAGRFAYFGSPAARRAQIARIPVDAKIHQNTKRLTHYIEESNTGRGFIKEMSFSHCGRILASPFGYGVRLLGWNSSCSDLMECVPKSPVQMYEFGHKTSHKDSVVSTAFNPCHWQLVTGCLGGKICWHSPVF